MSMLRRVLMISKDCRGIPTVCPTSSLGTTSCGGTSTEVRPCAVVVGDHGSATRGMKPNRVFMLNRHKAERVDLAEALRALRAYSLSTVPETIELALHLNMVLKKNKLRDPFRGSLLYPFPFGTQRKILALIEEKHRDIAERAGADIIGGEDFIAKLQEDGLEFDVCVATPALHDKMRHLQKKLRAKMPNPKKGTVVDVKDFADAIMKFQQSCEFKCSKNGFINIPVGKMDFSQEQIAKNISFLLNSVSVQAGSTSSSSLIKLGVLSSTYGPGFPIEIAHLI